MTQMIWAFPGDVTDRQLEGFEVRAPDGTIGTVDKATYDIGASYLVVDTGPWIFGKRVLLPAGLIHRVGRLGSQLGGRGGAERHRGPVGGGRVVAARGR